jgi:hypothetical protein
MHQYETSSAIPASVDATWPVLSDVSGWPDWGELFPRAAGSLVVGTVLDLDKRNVRGEPEPFAPAVASVTPPTEFVLEARVGPSGALRRLHTFRLDPVDDDNCALLQRWVTDTPIDDARWDAICAGMSRMSRFGDGLAARMSSTRQAHQADPGRGRPSPDIHA